MILRPATPQDAAPLAALSVEVWLGTYLHQGIEPAFADYVLTTLTAKNLLTQISTPAEQITVAEENGICGFIRVTKNHPCPVAGGPNTEISTFYVRPNSQGQGIGQALLKQAVDTTDVWLATNSKNTPAIGFYHASGFKTVGQTHFQLGDNAYPNDVLTRTL